MSQNAFDQIEREKNEAEALREHARMEMTEMTDRELTEPAANATGWTVYLDGYVVGEIRQVAGGYQYFPKGQKTGGAVWPSITGCKRDIEGYLRG